VTTPAEAIAAYQRQKDRAAAAAGMVRRWTEVALALTNDPEAQPE
jgi:hypothetical protein